MSKVGTATLDEVLAIVGNDCRSRWTPETVRYFFNGNASIDVLYLLDAKGPEDIPTLDKLWVIDKCGMLTDAQKAAVRGRVSELITDKSSAHFSHYINSGRGIYSYGPVASFLAESTGRERSYFVGQIEAAIINAIREVL